MQFFQANYIVLPGFTGENPLVVNRQFEFECKGIIEHLFQNKIVKFVWLSWPGKKKKVPCLILHDTVTRFQMSCKAFFSGKSP